MNIKLLIISFFSFLGFCKFNNGFDFAFFNYATNASNEPQSEKVSIKFDNDIYECKINSNFILGVDVQTTYRCKIINVLINSNFVNFKYGKNKIILDGYSNNLLEGENKLQIEFYLDDETVIIDRKLFVHIENKDVIISVTSYEEAFPELNNVNKKNGSVNLKEKHYNGIHNLHFNENLNSGYYIVSGRVMWPDAAGSYHPLKKCDITYTLGGIGLLDDTDNDGYFECTVGDDFFTANSSGTFSIYLQGDSYSINNNSNQIYVASFSKYYTLINNIVDLGTIYIDQYTIPTNFLEATSVHQAILLGESFFRVQENTLPPTVNVKFPVNDTSSKYYFSTQTIQIIYSRAYFWDVILHEYGHHIAHHFDLVGNNSSGRHSFTESLNNTYGKQIGMNLSWSESWATYFSITAQVKMNSANYGIPYVGDYYYNNCDDGGYNLKTGNFYHENLFGESCESSLIQTLIYLDESIYFSEPNISLWDFCKTYKPTNFSIFASYLNSLASYSDQNEIGMIYRNFNISSNLISPINGKDEVNDDQIFYWSNSGGTGQYVNNKFQLCLFNENFNLIYESPVIYANNYTIPYSNWRSLTNSLNSYLYRAVKCYQTTAFQTGYYFTNFNKIYKNHPIDYNELQNNYINCDSNNCKWVRFIPPISGSYNFLIETNSNIEVEIFNSFRRDSDSNGRLYYANNFNNNSYLNSFFELTAPDNYWIRIRNVNNFDLNTCLTITIDESSHQHSFEYSNLYYHVNYCEDCGLIYNENEPHLLDGDYLLLHGNDDYVPCICCETLINKQDASFPVYYGGRVYENFY